MDANPQAIHDLKPPYSNSISAEDVLRNTASELGDIAQDANALVARVALTCKQPALAAQVKECFSRLMAMNAEQGRALAHTVDPSAVEAAHDAARDLAGEVDHVGREDLRVGDRHGAQSP